MDIKRINSAIDYIEHNLNKKVDFDQLEKIAQMSRYNFQKVFSILSGMTLGTYIRKRRISEAMYLLKETDMKIIDIAYESVYMTPDSFSNAFKIAVGVTPNEFRNSDLPITTFPRMNISVKIKGGISMTYKLRELEGLSVLGAKRTYNTMEEAQATINQFWNEFSASGREEELIKLADGKIEGMLGVCVPKGNGMDYFIAVSSSQEKAEWEKVTIPSGRYLVFEAKGPVPTEIQRVTNEAYETVLPSNDYELRDAPEFELYPLGNPMSEDYITEIWIPIK